jgi:hypothetical protein
LSRDLKRTLADLRPLAADLALQATMNLLAISPKLLTVDSLTAYGFVEVWF